MLIFPYKFKTGGAWTLREAELTNDHGPEDFQVAGEACCQQMLSVTGNAGN